ncbi:hypothetical protein JXQ31_07130 [candidate division KSB1 bacterium]|nr:hypothetical protein [candidate division KSB1 bacterium]
MKLNERDLIPDTCPHCGRKLSPWEQVLLRVDRALMCKGCWYRIFLDSFENPKPKVKKPGSDKEE